jgi:FlaG/FlaF family flagellin (archaellin)
MKSTKTLVLAASILALTLSAFPQVASADTATTQQASSDVMRKGGGSKLIYVQFIVAAGNLISLLVHF